MAGIEIQAGSTYWVQIDGTRLKLCAVERADQIPGWWCCRAQLGTEIMAPESAFQESTNDEPDN